MTRPGSRGRSVVRVKTLVATAVVAAAALVAAAAVTAAPPPTQLLGTWTRTVSKSDVARAHATRVKPGSKWTLVIAPAKAVASSPGFAPFTGKFTLETVATVSLSVGNGKYNLYGWQRVGNLLVFNWQKDDNANRRAVLAGVWKRH